ADDVVREALSAAVARISERMPSVREVTMSPEGLPVWCANQRKLQAFEFGRTFKEWVERCNPTFSYEVAGSLVNGMSIVESDMGGPRDLRIKVRSHLDALLDGNKVLCLPTAPILPIKRTATLTEMRRACDRIVDLTCIAGLAGLPQVNLPLGESDGIPVGLSLIGPWGSDLQLLALAKMLVA
ncbi:MAG: putative amidase, partial [Rhizobacter sp.]|nr:putative amidase [Rhizobacter sp.]